jgi:tetratricopeptide (TPR) repeat protein
MSASLLVRRISVLMALAMVLGLSFHAAAVAQETEDATDATAEETTDEAAAAPAAITGEEAEAAAKEGDAALTTGDWESAIAAYNKLLQFGAQHQYEQPGQLALLIGYTGRGRAMAGLQEYEAADEDFRAALEMNPQFSLALIARGNMYLDTNRADQALPDFQAAVKADRGNIDAQFGLGKAYVSLGGSQQAITPLSRVITAQPENAEAYRHRGTAYAGIFKNVEALGDLQQALALNPSDYEAHFTLGMVHLRNEDYQQSVDSFEKAIEHYKPKPGQEDLPFLQGYLTLSSAYIEMGKAAEDEAAKTAAYQEAFDQAQKVVGMMDEKNPTYAQARASALGSRGVAERMLDDYATAIRTFSEAIEINPEFSEAYFRRGICFHRIGEDRMAIADFAQSAMINYEDPRANLWEGFTWAKIGDYHQAVRAYGNAIAASDRYTPAYVNRGLAYLQLQEYEKAVADFNEAIRLEPADANNYYKRGIAYEGLDDDEKASASYATAIALDSKHAAAYARMANVLQRQGRTDLAGQYRQKASELAPRQSAQ